VVDEDGWRVVMMVVVMLAMLIVVVMVIVVVVVIEVVVMVEMVVGGWICGIGGGDWWLKWLKNVGGGYCSGCGGKVGAGADDNDGL
jgi:hypothetical protein